MATTGLATIDHAPQVVAEWLNVLEAGLGWEDRHRAYMLLRATLHAVRDALPVNEAADLAAQLPVLVRGIYYEGWQPARTAARARTREDFVGRAVAGFRPALPADEAERAVTAALGLLATKVSAGEVDQVVKAMRGPLRELWPQRA